MTAIAILFLVLVVLWGVGSHREYERRERLGYPISNCPVCMERKGKRYRRDMHEWVYRTYGSGQANSYFNRYGLAMFSKAHWWGDYHMTRRDEVELGISRRRIRAQVKLEERAWREHCEREGVQAARVRLKEAERRAKELKFEKVMEQEHAEQ